VLLTLLKFADYHARIIQRFKWRQFRMKFRDNPSPGSKFITYEGHVDILNNIKLKGYTRSSCALWTKAAKQNHLLSLPFCSSGY